MPPSCSPSSTPPQTSRNRVRRLSTEPLVVASLDFLLHHALLCKAAGSSDSPQDQGLSATPTTPHDDVGIRVITISGDASSSGSPPSPSSPPEHAEGADTTAPPPFSLPSGFQGFPACTPAVDQEQPSPQHLLHRISEDTPAEFPSKEAGAVTVAGTAWEGYNDLDAPTHRQVRHPQEAPHSAHVHA